MKHGAAAAIFTFLALVCAAMAIDTSDMAGNMSAFVDYSDIEEEDKKYTLEKLTTDTDEEWDLQVTEQTEKENSFANRTGGRKEGRILPATLTAVSGQFPYYCYIKALQKDLTTTVDCGGALLSDTWVLTAATCVATAASITVLGGVISSTATTPTSPGIATVHPGYKKNYLIHNIALVRLQTPYTLSSTVYPIKLAKKDQDHNLNGYSLTVMGFGPADTSTAVVAALHYVELVQLSKGTCNLQTSEIYVSYPSNTGCLSTSTSSRGFCYGDTGGPVVYTFPKDVAVTLVGIMSEYQSCPSAYPQAYTRVGPYIHWIRSLVKKLLT